MKLSRLVDWQYIIFLISIQLVLKFGFINFFNLTSKLTNSLAVLLTFANTLIILAGFFINFSAQKKSKKAFLYYLICIAVGLGLGIYIAFKTYFIINTAIFLLFGFIVSFFSVNLKNNTVLKNILISLLASYSILSIWWFHIPDNFTPKQWQLFLILEVIVILIAILAFIANLIKTIIKNLKLSKRNKLNSSETIIKVFGIKKTKNIVVFLSILSTISVLTTLLIYARKPSSYLILIVFVIPQIYLLNLFLNAKTYNDYKKINIKLTVSFYVYLAIIPFIAYLIKNAF